MSAALQDLLAVQDLDLTLDQLRHRRAHAPEREELARIDGEVRALEGRSGEIDAARAVLTDRQAKAEAELAATEERAGVINKRLYGGEVSATKDLQAMSAELDQLKARSSALEDAGLEVLEALEPLDAQAADVQAGLERLAGERAEAASRLAEAEADIDSEAAEVSARRKEAATRVPEALLATYERLRARLGGVGVARLVGNHCDGCHLTLSAAELDQVRHLPEGEVYTCEQCSRILVP
ncbi:MAG TPA: C4-type zinc ribbon domain-containing protein [Acidimicrobiales bacterium]|nr:C4-type zinc ribbon domain-containing protein [Acidimicrobiales bacterium]